MKTTKEVQNNRIIEIVQRNPGMDVSKLKSLYAREFGEPLIPRLSGFTKLSKVLLSIPDMDVEIWNDTAFCTYYGQSPQPTMAGQPHHGRLARARDELPPTRKTHEGPEKLDMESMSNWVPTMNLQEAVELKTAESWTPATEDQAMSELDNASRSVALKDYFASGQMEGIQGFAKSSVLGSDVFPFKECSLLGCLQLDDALKEIHLEEGTPIYLNTHQPFCLATVGIQGAGKSHSLACIIESCLLSFETENISTLKNPMTALVLHYSTSVAL